MADPDPDLEDVSDLRALFLADRIDESEFERQVALRLAPEAEPVRAVRDDGPPARLLTEREIWHAFGLTDDPA